jgi:hypothetical protein
MLHWDHNERNITMKKVLLSLFAVTLVIAVLAGTGFAGYRVGYDQAARASGNDSIAPHWLSENRGRDEMPRFNFGRDTDGRPEHAFDRGFPRGYFRMMPLMPRGRELGIFSLLRMLAHFSIWVLVLALVYLLFIRSGWRLSVTKQPIQAPPAPVETEANPPDPNSENE